MTTRETAVPPYTATREAHPLQVEMLRLMPGQDLKATLDRFVRERGYRAAVVLSCAGSVRRAVLRLADGASAMTYEQTCEIVALGGTLSADGSHLHIALADAAGAVIGGHLKEGTLIHTTAELALGVAPGVVFTREPDAVTGYAELKISG